MSCCRGPDLCTIIAWTFNCVGGNQIGSPDDPGEADGVLWLTRSVKNELLDTKCLVKNAYLLRAVTEISCIHIN